MMKNTITFFIGLLISFTSFGQSIEEQMKKSEELYESGKYQDAIRELTQLLVMDPENADAYLLRAISYSASGNYKLAKPDYNKAIKLNPKEGRFYYNRAVFYDYQGKTKKALADYNKTIEFSPGDADGYYNRAIIFDKQKKYKKSIKDYSKAIELDSTNPDLYNNRGLAYKNSGKLEKAIADYSKSIEINPDYSMAYYNRARVRVYLGKKDKACEDFKKAAELGNQGAKKQYEQKCINRPANLVEYIKRETIDGEIDFNKILEDKQQSLYVYDGVAYNKKDFAIYLWGKKVRILGLKSAETAINIYEEIVSRELTDSEIKALKNGFNSEDK